MSDPSDSLLSSYDYSLDPSFIAQQPSEPRHAARLLIVEEQKVVSDTGKTTYTNDQKHKEEVPAFLRRQAN